ncbi:MAG: trypsin-like serine peptidase [Sandaracinaceae bacterium]
MEDEELARLTERVRGLNEAPADLLEAVERTTHRRTQDLLRERLPDVARGAVETEPAQEATRARLDVRERIIRDANFLPVSFLERGVAVSRAVARVALRRTHAGLPAGNGWGTGSLVSESLFLTNHHVIRSASEATRLFRAEFNYQLDLEGLPVPPDAFLFDPEDVFITHPALDFTLLRVRPKQRSAPSSDRSPGTLGRPMAPGELYGFLRLGADLDPDTGTRVPLRDERVNVVQHPRGRFKEVTLQSNQVTDVFSNVVQYTSDTEPGSSGSPVFDNDWELIALHHAAGTADAEQPGRWLDNQGIRVDAIVKHLRQHASEEVLTELGLA